MSDERDRLVATFRRSDRFPPEERQGLALSDADCSSWQVQPIQGLGELYMLEGGCLGYLSVDSNALRAGRIRSSYSEICDGRVSTEWFDDTYLSIAPAGLVFERGGDVSLRRFDGGIGESLSNPERKDVELACPLVDGGWVAVFCGVRESTAAGFNSAGKKLCIDYRLMSGQSIPVSGYIYCDAEGLAGEIATIVSAAGQNSVVPLITPHPEPRAFMASRSAAGEFGLVFEVAGRPWVRSLLLSPGDDAWRFGPLAEAGPNTLEFWFPLGRRGVRVLVDITARDGFAKFMVPNATVSQSFRTGLDDPSRPWMLPLRQVPSSSGTLVSELGCALIIAGVEDEPRLLRCLPSSNPVGVTGVYRISTDPYDDDTWVVMRTVDQAILVKDGTETVLPTQSELGVWFVSKGEPFFVGGIRNWLEARTLVNAVRSPSHPEGAWLEVREGRLELRGRDGSTQLLAEDFFVAGLSEHHVIGASGGRLVQLTVP
ncbi:MAG: hypothetical protein INH41_21805 [Myxococcaceae bacterium]|nr:hypothetical protein [Myxococcaceae bacterium]MCA3015031.1 hypothetical protein [Myxococcaceae bacterium]